MPFSSDNLDCLKFELVWFKLFRYIWIFIWRAFFTSSRVSDVNTFVKIMIGGLWRLMWWTLSWSVTSHFLFNKSIVIVYASIRSWVLCFDGSQFSVLGPIISIWQSQWIPIQFLWNWVPLMWQDSTNKIVSYKFSAQERRCENLVSFLSLLWVLLRPLLFSWLARKLAG